MNGRGLPKYAKIAAIAQIVFTLCTVCLWIVWATWGVFPNSLVMSTAVFGVPMILAVASLIGLWRGKMFGWVTGIVANCILVIFFPWGGLLCVIPAAMVVLLLSGPVRGFYVRNYYE
jgi:hypothetical protein